MKENEELFELSNEQALMYDLLYINEYEQPSAIVSVDKKVNSNMQKILNSLFEDNLCKTKD